MDPDDLIVWPDGESCYGDELEQMNHKSDDFEILRYGTAEYDSFVRYLDQTTAEERIEEADYRHSEGTSFDKLTAAEQAAILNS